LTKRESVNKFAQLPFIIKLLVVLVGVFVFVKYSDLILSISYSNPLKYIAIAFFLPVYSLCAMPILTFLGIADFKSELLFTTAKKKDKLFEIHFGSLFDCIMSGLFTGKRGSFRNLMLYFLVDGLWTIVEEIESGKIHEDAEIIGTSYFFNADTAERFGFQLDETIVSHKYILYLNYLEILLVHSLSKGRFSAPDFSTFKTVKASASGMLEKKESIKKYHQYLKGKVNLEG